MAARFEGRRVCGDHSTARQNSFSGHDGRLSEYQDDERMLTIPPTENNGTTTTRVSQRPSLDGIWIKKWEKVGKLEN